MLDIEQQPLQVCKEHGISSQELARMVKSSAKYTHLWANRRYDDWIFDVDLEDMHVYRMGIAAESLKNTLTNGHT